jgi:hypothetical protein
MQGEKKRVRKFLETYPYILYYSYVSAAHGNSNKNRREWLLEQRCYGLWVGGDW